MSITTFRNLLLAIIFAGFLGFPMGESKALQTAALDLVSPNVCPSSGCAAGQRLNFKIDFSVDKLDATVTQPDLQVCMYSPQNWAANQFEFAPTGTVSGKAYVSNTTNCDFSPVTACWAALSANLPFPPELLVICFHSVCASENPPREAAQLDRFWCGFTYSALAATGER